ncbi:MAG: amino acid ABC transporter permease [Holosporales bacterium]|jgi:polar amino acid transport system permease protein|nr:amino acid ABC transporter permease [Holosporales bacterium]
MIDILQSARFIATGISVTLEVSAGAFLIGITFGSIFAIARRIRICRPIVTFIVSILRGTPVILQLSIIYFATTWIMKLSIISAGIIAFGINSSAYVSEIFRSGIESLPRGQFEASQTLEIPKFHMWKKIIFPQVFHNMLPALINESISLLKETAIIGIIGGMDITRTAQAIASEHYDYFTPLCIAGVYYYCLTTIIELIGRKIEQRRLYT